MSRDPERASELYRLTRALDALHGADNGDMISECDVGELESEAGAGEREELVRTGGAPFRWGEDDQEEAWSSESESEGEEEENETDNEGEGEDESETSSSESARSNVREGDDGVK